MSIAEKLVKVAENQQKVFDAGGLSQCLKNKASGEVVSISDVAPVEHNMAVKLESKNVIPYPYQLGTRTINEITFTDNGDGTITANGTANAPAYYVLWEHIKEKVRIQKGEKYTLSGCPAGGGSSTYQLSCQCVENNGWLNLWDKGTGATTTAKGDAFVKVLIYIAKGATVDNVVFKPMLEKGTVATSYTPYIADISTVKLIVEESGLMYTPYADGTVANVKSVYPTTTLKTDTSGVLAQCEYYQDARKVKQDLTDLIISLGGEI